MEQLRPDDLEAILAAAPVAYVPLGTFEHHGWHLPVGFDGVKAQALCRRVAERTGGVVLPPFWYGIGGGHVGYKWTVIVAEEQVRPLLALTLEHLARFGFRVVVLLTDGACAGRRGGGTASRRDVPRSHGAGGQHAAARRPARGGPRREI
jgi:creatinine amidohydrolase